jgi:cytochrome bd ubiquinol oxidase subunit II
MDLNTIWFLLVGVLFTGYAVLDGFDLGVGVLFLLVKEDKERRIFLNAIGPIWNGNEVWLVTGGWRIVRGLSKRVCDCLLRIL